MWLQRFFTNFVVKIDDRNMKSVEQINRYLSSCIFDNDGWERVLAFCREQYGGGKVHRPRRGRYQASFADFITWFKYMPGQGEIIKYGNIIGMVGKCTPSDYVLCAYISQNGQLILKDMVVSPHKLTKATSDEEARLRSLMSKSKIAYSVNLAVFVDVLTPDDGDFVIVKQGKLTRYGIFNRSESESYIFHFLENREGKIEQTVIPFSECEIELASSREGLKLLEILHRLGVTWNAKDKTFLPVPAKAVLGGKYWYINDKFYVCQCKDLQTPVHKERYKNGNYFTSYAEALSFLQRLKDLRIAMSKGLDL